jgi:hypothetical protein
MSLIKCILIGWLLTGPTGHTERSSCDSQRALRKGTVLYKLLSPPAICRSTTSKIYLPTPRDVLSCDEATYGLAAVIKDLSDMILLDLVGLPATLLPRGQNHKSSLPSRMRHRSRK